MTRTRATWNQELTGGMPPDEFEDSGDEMDSARCRAKTQECGAAGECLRCGADQGVTCRQKFALPIDPTPPEGAHQ